MSAFRSFLLIISSSILLVACSEGPSKSDIKNVIQEEIITELNNQLNMIKFFAGDSAAKRMGIPDPESIKVDNVEIIDKKKTDSGNYLVNVKYKLKAGDEVTTETTLLTMTKINDKWKILDVK